MDLLEHIFNGLFNMAGIEDLELEKSHENLYVIFTVKYEDEINDIKENLERKGYVNGQHYWNPVEDEESVFRICLVNFDKVRFDPNLDKIEGWDDNLPTDQLNRNLIALQGKPSTVQMIDTANSEVFYVPLLNQFRVSNEQLETPEEAIEKAKEAQKEVIINTADLLKDE